MEIVEVMKYTSNKILFRDTWLSPSRSMDDERKVSNNQTKKAARFLRLVEDMRWRQRMVREAAALDAGARPSKLLPFFEWQDKFHTYISLDPALNWDEPLPPLPLAKHLAARGG